MGLAPEGGLVAGKSSEDSSQGLRPAMILDVNSSGQCPSQANKGLAPHSVDFPLSGSVVHPNSSSLSRDNVTIINSLFIGLLDSRCFN